MRVSPGSPSTVLKRLHCTDPSEVETQLIHRPSKNHWVLLTDSSWLLVFHTWEEVQLDCRHQEVRPRTRPTTCRPAAMLLYGPQTPAVRTRVRENFERSSDVLHHIQELLPWASRDLQQKFPSKTISCLMRAELQTSTYLRPQLLFSVCSVDSSASSQNRLTVQFQFLPQTAASPQWSPQWIPQWIPPGPTPGSCGVVGRRCCGRPCVRRCSSRSMNLLVKQSRVHGVQLSWRETLTMPPPQKWDRE